MKRFNDYRDITSRHDRIVTIGNFDGIHIGHQAVLKSARKRADEMGLELAVFTFNPHPVEVINPNAPSLRIIQCQRKAELLGECNVDLVLSQHFDEQFMGLSTLQFAKEVLAEALCTKAVIVGSNFRYGASRVGNVDMLREHGEKLGFKVFDEKLVSAGESTISSSRIRRAIIAGNVSHARAMLGRCHELPASVVHGMGHGAALGFPTINLDKINVLVPGHGIYAAFCDIDGTLHKAAVYIGNRPTMGYGKSIEAHILDYNNDLYSKRVIVHFVERVRGEKRFDSEDQLKKQMAIDVECARQILMKEPNIG